MGWIKHTEDTNLPEYLRKNLNAMCSYCGTEKENYYNDEGRCTNRRCPNKQCPGTLGRKIAEMCDILKWEGVGEGTGRRLVHEHKLTSHFEAIPLLVKSDTKPKISLSTLFRLTFIEGIDRRWEETCKEYKSVSDMLSRYKGRYYEQMMQNKDELLYGEKFFTIETPVAKTFKPIISGNVMISGSIKGFNERNSFISALNLAGDGLIELSVVGKRKTDVMALIQEADSPNQGKAACAIENGIPIMTPDAFKTMVFAKVAECVSKGELERR